MNSIPTAAQLAKPMLSEQVYEAIKADILHRTYEPGAPLKPQELASSMGVSLAVAREALLRLVGEGLADRRPNHGFTVPSFSDARWKQIVEARQLIEPGMLRLAIQRGDLSWEANIRAAFHRLTRTPLHDADGGPYHTEDWGSAHYQFHRALLEGCGNAVLLQSFDRLWTAGDLARRWAGLLTPHRDHVGEHTRLEEAVLARTADAAADILTHHLSLTAAAFPNDNSGDVIRRR